MFETELLDFSESVREYQFMALQGQGGPVMRGLNASVVATQCVDNEASSCDVYKDPVTGFEAALKLGCTPYGGNGALASAPENMTIVSSLVGGSQYLVAAQYGFLRVGVVDYIACWVQSEWFNSGPIAYTFELSPLYDLPTMVEEQQAAIGSLYDACCAEEGACSTWKAANQNLNATILNPNASVFAMPPLPENGRRRGRLLSQAPVPAPEEEIVVVPSPDAEVPSVEVPVAEAPSPVAEAPSPASNVPAGTSPSVYVDFCRVAGNRCTPDGFLTTLYVSGFEMSCDVSTFASIVKDIPSLENVVMTNNPGIVGSLSEALAEFVDGKSNNTSGFTWKNIRMDNTSISGSFVADVTGPQPICSLIDDGLLQFSFHNTSIDGSFDPCMFDSESSALQLLFGSETGISNVTAEFGQASFLRSVRLANASLTGSIGSLPETLAEFQASNNNLTGTLPTPGNLSILYDVSGNQLSGGIPDGFVDHPTLRMVSVYGNQLDNMPMDWVSTTFRPKNNPPLQWLNFGSNPIQNGSFPAGFSFYPNLTHIIASESQMSGPLPDLAEGAFPGLYYLAVEKNNISGTVPDSWESITLFARSYEYSRTGNFSNNSMSGVLPAWLGDTFLDATYDFSGNNFSNGCDEQFKNIIGACNGEEVTPSPDASPLPPAPSPENVPKSDDDGSGDGGGTSGGLIAAIVIISLIIIGIGGYFVYKYYRARKNEGRFTRFDDTGVQMTSNQAYNQYMDP